MGKVLSILAILNLFDCGGCRAGDNHRSCAGGQSEKCTGYSSYEMMAPPATARWTIPYQIGKFEITAGQYTAFPQCRGQDLRGSIPPVGKLAWATRPVLGWAATLR